MAKNGSKVEDVDADFLENGEKSLFSNKNRYIVFTLDQKCPVTVSDQAKILLVKT